MADNKYRYIELHFDQAKQPKFKEFIGKKWIEFGDDNNYPKYLLSLFNESSKHGSIVKGKSNYIFGKGFENAGKANSKNETWNDVLKKCIKDDELFGGYYLQIIWNRAKQISDVYHIDFHKVRCSKDLTKFYIKNDWHDIKERVRDYEAFNIDNPFGSQIFYKKQYNSLSDVYPLPSYFQALNYIESDIEVSRHILANAKRGWVGNTLINLNNGEPPSEENKGEIEKGLLKKFTGADGKRVVIMFNQSKENAAEVVDLGNSILTKEDFTNINNLIQQEIFAGHQITSPSLFGIKTEGQLGARNEIRDAYEIFNNTYVKERQMDHSIIFTKLRNAKGEQGEFNIVPVEPLKFEFTESIMSMNLTKDEIREIMGKEPVDNAIKTEAQNISDNINSLSPLVATKVLESMTTDEIRSLAGLAPKIAGSTTSVTNPDGTITEQPQLMANDAIKNLTGRQYQNVMRIVRNFGNGKLTKQQASLMLKSGFGFNDNDVNMFLGIDDDPITDDEVEKFYIDEDLKMYNEFTNCGESFDVYEILNSFPIREFATFATELNQLQTNVLEILTKNKNITAEKIAESLDQKLPDINKALNSLIDKKIIKIQETKISGSEIISGAKDILKTYDVIKPPSKLDISEPTIEEVFVRFTYEWRDDINASDKNLDTSRAFCQKLYDLSAHSKDVIKTSGRTWSMTDIQNMSFRLGYSVLDRCGGWWRKPSGEISAQCRHQWVANLVKKKK